MILSQLKTISERPVENSHNQKNHQSQPVTVTKDARPTLPAHGNKEEIQSTRYQTTQLQPSLPPPSQLTLLHQKLLLNKDQFQHATLTLIQDASKPPLLPQSTLLHSGRLMLKSMRRTSFKATQSATVPSAANTSTQRRRTSTQSTIPFQTSESTTTSRSLKPTQLQLETSTQTTFHQMLMNQLTSN